MNIMMILHCTRRLSRRIIDHNDYYDELSSLKFFVRLRQSIEHDETFQQVIKRTRALLLRDGDEHLTTFNEALDKIIENEKSLIYQSFVNNTKEEKCDGNDHQAPSNSEDDKVCATNSVWCLMLKEIKEENLDVLEVFKLYIIYYLNIKSGI